VDVGVEAGEALVEVTRELQVAHDLRVEALAGMSSGMPGG
jgi:hypothetical protein